jgi:hypothetical protein
LGAAALAVYLAMVLGTLAQLQALSGLAPFDMRPGGYDLAEARALLEALGPGGRRFYLVAQIPLDALYPALMALTLSAALRWAGARGGLLAAGTCAAWGAAAADYGENAGIVAMILSWPETSVVLVGLSSLLSVAKAVLTTVAMLLLLCAIAGRVLRRTRRTG